MGEANQIVFKYRELAEMMVKQQGIHEGFWGLFIRFGLAAANISEEVEGNLAPAAIVPVKEIGIQKFDAENSLTVNAAIVNPAPPPPKSKIVVKAQKKRSG